MPSTGIMESSGLAGESTPASGAESCATNSTAPPPGGSATSRSLAAAPEQRDAPAPSLQSTFAAFKRRREAQRRRCAAAGTASVAGSGSRSCARLLGEDAVAWAYVADGNGCLLVRDTLTAMGFKLQRPTHRDKLPRCVAAPARGTHARSRAGGADSTTRPTTGSKAAPVWYMRWVPYATPGDVQLVQRATLPSVGGGERDGVARVLFNHITPVSATRRLVDKAGLLRVMRCAGVAEHAPTTFDLGCVRDRRAFAACLESRLVPATRNSSTARGLGDSGGGAYTDSGHNSVERRRLGTPTWWLLKPPQGSQGRGIQLVRGDAALLRLVHAMDVDAGSASGEDGGTAAHDPARMPPSLAQRYEQSPLTLGGFKFDLRVFVLVARTSPLLVLYFDGYARRCAEPYRDPGDCAVEDGGATSRVRGPLFSHLTNLSLQKRHPRFTSMRQDLAL